MIQTENEVLDAVFLSLTGTFSVLQPLHLRLGHLFDLATVAFARVASLSIVEV